MVPRGSRQSAVAGFARILVVSRRFLTIFVQVTAKIMVGDAERTLSVGPIFVGDGVE